MKKLVQYLMVALFLFPVAPATLYAEESNGLKTINKEAISKHTHEQTMRRLKEIKLRAKSHLSKAEKKELREEVLSIRKKHERPDGVIYISTGGLILIIILLIILL